MFLKDVITEKINFFKIIDYDRSIAVPCERFIYRNIMKTDVIFKNIKRRYFLIYGGMKHVFNNLHVNQEFCIGLYSVFRFCFGNV